MMEFPAAAVCGCHHLGGGIVVHPQHDTDAPSLGIEHGVSSPGGSAATFSDVGRGRLPIAASQRAPAQFP